MIGLAHYLMLAAVLFAIAVAGIFINRRNVILLLMCIELMLLAVNFNFVAFARAIVAAIALTMRHRTGLKAQDVGAQVSVRAKDRIRIVKMPAEKSR